MHGVDCGRPGLSLLENPEKREFGQYLSGFFFFLNVVYPVLGPDVTSGGKEKFPLNFVLHKEECCNKSVLSMKQCL